jgi:hypothetical protein
MKTTPILLIALILSTSCNDIKRPQKESIPNKMVFLGYELGESYSEVFRKTNELEKEKMIDSVLVTNQNIKFNSEIRTSTTNEYKIDTYNLDVVGNLNFYKDSLYNIKLSINECPGLLELYEKRYGKYHTSSTYYSESLKQKSEAYNWKFHHIKINIHLIYKEYLIYSRIKEKEEVHYSIHEVYVTYIDNSINQKRIDKIKGKQDHKERIKKQKFQLKQDRISKEIDKQQI